MFHDKNQPSLLLSVDVLEVAHVFLLVTSTMLGSLNRVRKKRYCGEAFAHGDLTDRGFETVPAGQLFLLSCVGVNSQLQKEKLLINFVASNTTYCSIITTISCAAYLPPFSRNSVSTNLASNIQRFDA